MSTLGLEPEPSSHDWHVQPSCQRPNRFPPERRVFSPEQRLCRDGRLARPAEQSSAFPKNNSACPRNLIKLLVLLLACQPIVPTGFPLEIHIGNSDRNCLAFARPDSRWRLSPRKLWQLGISLRTHLPPCCAAGSNVRFGASAFGTGFLSQSRAEDSWLRKDLFGGSCENRLNPSRTAVPESKPRGRG